MPHPGPLTTPQGLPGLGHPDWYKSNGTLKDLKRPGESHRHGGSPRCRLWILFCPEMPGRTLRRPRMGYTVVNSQS